MAPAVVAESLTKRFGALVAVDDLSFSLEPGTITGFLGPNGAGKTTTLRMLLGLAAPTSGRALVFGEQYAQVARAARRIGAVLEATDFHPGRSGRDHLRMLSDAVELPRSRVDQVLRLVELTDAAGRRVKGYSLGMRQRLGLAAALLGDPELLVLDEPANGLDPEGVRWLRDFLRAFAAPASAPCSSPVRGMRKPCVARLCMLSCETWHRLVSEERNCCAVPSISAYWQ
jgi:ABC-2 type transport system ATP-binding protein